MCSINLQHDKKRTVSEEGTHIDLLILWVVRLVVFEHLELSVSAGSN